jgi:hypothetical protein
MNPIVGMAAGRRRGLVERGLHFVGRRFVRKQLVQRHLVEQQFVQRRFVQQRLVRQRLVKRWLDLVRRELVEQLQQQLGRLVDVEQQWRQWQQQRAE